MNILEKVSFSPVCESNLKDCTFSSHFQYLLFKEKNSFREHRQAEAGGDEKSNVCEEMGTKYKRKIIPVLRERVKAPVAIKAHMQLFLRI
jgi:hypothetical protein